MTIDERVDANGLPWYQRNASEYELPDGLGEKITWGVAIDLMTGAISRDDNWEIVAHVPDWENNCWEWDEEKEENIPIFIGCDLDMLEDIKDFYGYDGMMKWVAFEVWT